MNVLEFRGAAHDHDVKSYLHQLGQIIHNFRSISYAIPLNHTLQGITKNYTLQGITPRNGVSTVGYWYQ